MLCSTCSIFRWFDLWSYSSQTAHLSHHLKLKTSLDSSPAVPFSSPSGFLYTKTLFLWDHCDVTGLTLMWPQLSAEAFFALLSGYIVQNVMKCSSHLKCALFISIYIITHRGMPYNQRI